MASQQIPLTQTRRLHVTLFGACGKYESFALGTVCSEQVAAFHAQTFTAEKAHQTSIPYVLTAFAISKVEQLQLNGRLFTSKPEWTLYPVGSNVLSCDQLIEEGWSETARHTGLRLTAPEASWQDNILREILKRDEEETFPETLKSFLQQEGILPAKATMTTSEARLFALEYDRFIIPAMLAARNGCASHLYQSQTQGWKPLKPNMVVWNPTNMKVLAERTGDGEPNLTTRPFDMGGGKRIGAAANL